MFETRQPPEPDKILRLMAMFAGVPAMTRAMGLAKEVMEDNEDET